MRRRRNVGADTVCARILAEYVGDASLLSDGTKYGRITTRVCVSDTP